MLEEEICATRHTHVIAKIPVVFRRFSISHPVFGGAGAGQRYVIALPLACLPAEMHGDRDVIGCFHAEMGGFFRFDHDCPQAVADTTPACGGGWDAWYPAVLALTNNGLHFFDPPRARMIKQIRQSMADILALVETDPCM